MAIPESQLGTWSHQGSIQQSTATYGTVKGVLDSTKSPYYLKSFESFLQGSYGNDTNIYADSDIDIVLRLDSTYYHDTSALPGAELTAFNAAFVPAPYSLDDFKRDVVGWLASPANFGSAVTPSAKAIYIAPQGNRRIAHDGTKEFASFSRMALWSRTSPSSIRKTARRSTRPPTAGLSQRCACSKTCATAW